MHEIKLVGPRTAALRRGIVVSIFNIGPTFTFTKKSVLIIRNFPLPEQLLTEVAGPTFTFTIFGSSFSVGHTK